MRLLRVWVDQLLAVLAKEPHRGVPRAQRVGLALPSRHVPVALVAPAVQDLAAVREAPVVLVADLVVAPVEVARVPGDADVVLVAVQLVRLVAAAERATLASQSGRSVKSSKCGRHRASAASRFLGVMDPR